MNPYIFMAEFTSGKEVALASPSRCYGDTIIVRRLTATLC
jgi:hypothetical protein